jgi:peptidoglycan/xylan/chitin deacetylase (PgdA/CDA1 family)
MKFIDRALAKGRRTLARSLRRRELRIDAPTPFISFSFDDAPCTAFGVGREILESHSLKGTYYVALGLLSSVSEIGPIASADELLGAVHAGHELGCHTFDHCDAWKTDPAEYIASVDRNGQALHSLLPGLDFRSFAYPKSGATLAVKAALEQRFDCCRGGGQSVNAGKVDLNLLNACFLDRRTGIDIDEVQALIERNAERRGWLIFVAHDIAAGTTPFGCDVAFFEHVVRLAARSGARIAPVGATCARLVDGRAGLVDAKPNGRPHT